MKKMFLKTLALMLCLFTGLSMISACGNGEKDADPTVVTGIKLSVNQYTFTSYDTTFYLSAIVEPATAVNQNVVWASSNPNIVNVDQNGSLKAYSNGSAVISVTTEDGGFTAACNVTVNVPVQEEVFVPINVAFVEFLTKEYTLTVEDEQQLYIDILPSGSTNKNVTYATSDEKVATVDANGLVKAVKKGTATITVTTEDGGYTADCVITVQAKPTSSSSSGNSSSDNTSSSGNTGSSSGSSSTKLPSVPSPVIDGAGYLVSDNLEAFNKVNSDVVAWLHLPGTNINFPVAQASDNDYYLSKGLNKKSKETGSCFLDYRSSLKKTGKISERHTIMYGHAKGTDIFDQLENETLKTEWFNDKDNLYVYVNTLYEETVWKVFATYYINSDENYYLNMDFLISEDEYQKKKAETDPLELARLAMDPKALNDFLFDEDAFLDFALGWKNRVDVDKYSKYSYLRDRDYGVTIDGDDRILTLSTCADTGTTYKYVLHAVLVQSRARTAR